MSVFAGAAAMLPNPKPFFELIPDPRRATPNKLHSLSDILSIALCAVLSGMDDWEAVAEFGRTKEGWLRQFLPLANGIPSHDTFGRVFSLIDPEAFEAAFFDWAAHARIGGDVLDQLALDGKTVRRSHRGSAGRALHLLHAWSCETRLLVAQRRVDTKSNEITAIPDILSLFDLRGVTISIDAIGCQKAVARQITEAGGDYVLALKGNQSALHDDVRLFMETQADRHPQGQAEAVEKDHGRIETRRIWVNDEIDWLTQKPDWPGLKTLVMVESRRELNGQVSCERRCFITSHTADPERVGRYIRHHWRVENSLHWVLDMAFNEDQSRARVGHAAENLAIIRRFALNLLRQSKGSKLGVKNKRLRAAYDDAFRALVLQLQPLEH
ncbi:ISAs1-like element ISXa1 family transposase [Marinobacterium ramblicola]|nr:ISAs1 family transposase [Marinobacterium ramblicola]RTL87446.1 ISAs1 family transposase [Ancylobacter aquaticus]